MDEYGEEFYERDETRNMDDLIFQYELEHEQEQKREQAKQSKTKKEELHNYVHGANDDGVEPAERFRNGQESSAMTMTQTRSARKMRNNDGRIISRGQDGQQEESELYKESAAVEEAQYYYCCRVQ